MRRFKASRERKAEYIAQMEKCIPQFGIRNSA